MADQGRMITAKLDDKLVEQLDEAADRIERSKSWIVREALTEWLAEDRRRYELTIDALAEVDAGRLVEQSDVEDWAAKRRKARAKASRAA
jgi:predicted transcriptional regulator